MDLGIAFSFVAAIAVGGLCRVKGINPALPLIATGFVADAINRDLGTSLDPEHVMTFLLAPIVFAAGLSSSALDLRKVRRTIICLAVLLVFISALVVGYVASLAIAGMTFGVAFALGAILAPTDAVAAGAVAKKVRLPRRILLIIEGESLANDGTALTVLRIAISIVVTGTVTMMSAAQIAGAAVLGGIAVGLIGGFIVAKAIAWVGDPIVGHVMALITPFVLYAFSEEIGGSGLLTVVIAGVVIGQFAALRGKAQAFRLQGKAIWGTVTFVLETIAFFLVGAEFLAVWDSITHPNPHFVILAAIGLTILTFVLRLAFTLLMGLYLLKRGQSGGPQSKEELIRGAIAVTVLGVRGPVSVLAAFSIPLTLDDGSPFPDRSIVLAITFVCVILSLLLVTLAGPIVKALNFPPESDDKMLAKARTSLGNAALIRLDEIQADGIDREEEVDPALIERIRQGITRKLEHAQAIRKGNTDHLEMEAQRKAITNEIITAQYSELTRLQTEEGLPGDIAKKLSTELDHSQETLR